MSKKAIELVEFLKTTEVAGCEYQKNIFQKKARSVLKELANLLKLNNVQLFHNHAGIAVSGDAYLYGLWDEGRGVSIYISPDMIPYNRVIMYRTITSLTDHTGGHNNWASLEDLADLENLAAKIKELKGNE